MEKCTHPDCSYVADYFITNHHCKTEHSITKKELIERYGKPEDITVNKGAFKFGSSPTFKSLS